MTTDTDTKSAADAIIDLNPDEVVDVDARKTEVPPPTPAKSSRTWPLLGLAALVLGGIGGGWLYRDYLSTYFPSNEMAGLIEKSKAMEADNATMREQLASIDTLSQTFKLDIDALEASINTTNSSVKSNGDGIGGLTARADTIDVAIADLRKAQAALQAAVNAIQAVPSPGTAAPPIDLSAITQRLDALEKDMASLKTRDGGADLSALSQSLSDLKAKFAAGAPFAAELQRVQMMAPAAPGLDDMARHAATGLPDAKALAQSLSRIATDLTPSPSPDAPPTDQSWMGWATDMLSDIVTIRNAGDADWAKTAEAAAAFADSGDLTQAISHVAEAEGAKPPALQQWLEQAQARVQLEGALAGVEAAVLRMLAAKG